MEDIIKVEGVAKAYGKHQVHKGLDLGIKKGECFTLLGPSGCGKTVLIRLIAARKARFGHCVSGLCGLAAHDGLR